MKTKILEKDVIAAILDYCAAERIFVQRRNVGAMSKEDENGKKRFVRFASPGQADLWGIINGRHFECETKAPGREPTQEQTDWLAACQAAGAIAFWVDNVDDFIAIIERMRS